MKDGKIQKGEMRFASRGQNANTFIYEFSDPFGSGCIGFEDRGGEVSGAMCFPPHFKKCGGSGERHNEKSLLFIDDFGVVSKLECRF